MHGWYEVGLENGHYLAAGDVAVALLCALTDDGVDVLFGHLAPIFLSLAFCFLA
jgi:hypothetical protein